MYSFTGLRNLYGVLTNNTTTSNLATGDMFVNNSLRQTYAAAPWDFLERTNTDTTVASQQAYNLPYDYDKLITVTVTIGTTQYIPREVADRDTWNFLNQNTAITSNIPAYYFILNNQLLFYPTPSSASNTITYTYRRRVRDLGIDDYTTGTITTLAAGGTAVTGSGTTWTTQMIGRYIRLTRSNTANAGDGEWYPITAVSSATSLTIGRAYAGTAVAAATAAYTIGEVPFLPEPYQQMPVYQAAVFYWTANDNPQKAQYFQGLFDVQMKQLRSDHLSKTTDDSIKSIIGGAMQNPNLYVLS